MSDTWTRQEVARSAVRVCIQLFYNAGFCLPVTGMEITQAYHRSLAPARGTGLKNKSPEMPRRYVRSTCFPASMHITSIFGKMISVVPLHRIADSVAGNSAFERRFSWAEEKLWRRKDSVTEADTRRDMSWFCIAIAGQPGSKAG